MKAIVKTTRAAGAELLDVPTPDVPRDGALVRIQNVSICGTDYHVYSWDEWASGRVGPTPLTMGHEWAGTVVAVGPDVKRLSVGDFVSGESHKVCGHCLQCRIRQAHVCRNTQIFGVDINGCFAEYFAAPESSIQQNDRRVPPAIASMQDPLGNAVHAVLAGEITGNSVAVLGCGPIGLFAIAVARASGAGTILASDTSEYRLDLARKVGADAVARVPGERMEDLVERFTSGEGVDVALEMSGATVAVGQALRVVRPGGRVALMGIPNKTVEIDVARDIIFKGLTVQGIVGRRLYQTWETMRSLLTSGRLDVSAILTHEMPFADFERGMELMRTGQCGKVVLHVSD